MRISKTFDWRPGSSCRCGWDECERFYCSSHRLLYRSCDTAVTMSERARWEDGGTKTWVEATGECPHCTYDAEMQRHIQQTEFKIHPTLAA